MLVEERKALLRRTERVRWSRSVPKEEFSGTSLSVQENFVSAFPPEKGMRIGIYKAVGAEVGTDHIRGCCLAAGAFLFYPRVMNDGHLSFYPDGGSDGWVRGKYGLLEPRVEPGTEGIRSGFDLVVVPGMAFDAKGGRLGKGYGYYDRFLSGLAETAVMVGLAFSMQMVPEVPVDSGDVPVDAVVTEDGVIRVSRVRPKGTSIK